MLNETTRARLRAWLDQTFGMDVRALALYRIALGALLLLDLLDRSRDLEAHYTDAGALPRALIPNVDGRLSLHMLSGDATAQTALFVLAGVASLGVLLGYQTRLAVFLSWVLNFSIQSRNPMVLYGGDIVLREILFWSNFLPLGLRYSLDARRAGPSPVARFLSAGSAAYLAQIALIYIVTAALKTGDDWQNGTAVWYTLQIDHFTSPLGRRLLAFPELLSVLTHLVYWFEVIGPWLLLLPLWRVRAPLVLAFIGMHLSFEVCMEIGLFPWISAVSWLPLLPGPLLDRLRLPRREGTTLGAPRWSQALALLTLAYITWWNLGSLYPKTMGVTGDWRVVARAIRLDQYWDMFAPEPLKDDGWFIIIGHREDGRRDDVLHGGPVSWAKPYDIANSYKNERWRKYMRNLWNKKYANLREPYLQWQCARWNRNASEIAKIKKITMIYMLERSPAPGHTAQVEKVVLKNMDCPTPG